MPFITNNGGLVGANATANASFSSGVWSIPTHQQLVGNSTWPPGNYVRSNLVLSLDPGNSGSYPGSGTTWTDMSGSGYNGTLSNTTFSGAGAGSFSFNGSSSTVSMPTVFSGYPFTVSMWVTHDSSWDPGPADMDQLFNMSIAGQRVSLGIVKNSGWVTGPTLMYGGTSHWSCPNPTNTSSSAWHNITWVVFGSNNSSHKIYIDGVSQTMTDNGGAHGGTAGWRIGSNSSSGEYWPGEISTVLAYNTTLTEAQVQQNFNYFRPRFGM